MLPSTYPRFSRSQYSWALLGFMVFILTLILALTNLQSIYEAQKDFIVGSLLSLTGFSFGKALSRTQEQKAIELIQTAPTEAVVAALARPFQDRFESAGYLRLMRCCGPG